jgi:RNA polymerase sigma-70 factor (ECF subfamily)
VPTTDSSEEIALVQRAQQGDAEAVAELYRRHAPAIFRYFYFRLHDQTLAEDLTSEVFLRMTLALPTYAERGAPFAAWLFRVAHDRIVDHHRHAARTRTETLSEMVLDDAPEVESLLAQQADYRHLVQAITTLSDEQQMVVQLRFIEGYSLEETAQIVGKNVGAVKALQHRALQNLARKLK